MKTKQPAARIELSAIYSELRDRICLLQYAPGTRLREEQIAKEFGISRTPVREVIQKLSFAGLVTSKNGIGTIVTEMDSSKLLEIYTLRSKLATMIGELTPNDCQPEQVAAVEKLLDRARNLKDSLEIRDYWMINHEMHFIISELIGNAPLREMWDHLYFQAARFWYDVTRTDVKDVADSLHREIEDILIALRMNDIAAIGYIERNYITYGLRKIKVHYGECELTHKIRTK
ncbi:MAG: GntR family transcriptional regulator [Rhodospirillales bacterium]|nr:GntR family transcriptional regulator [Rhodospirillales bacterium]